MNERVAAFVKKPCCWRFSCACRLSRRIRRPAHFNEVSRKVFPHGASVASERLPTGAGLAVDNSGLNQSGPFATSARNSPSKCRSRLPMNSASWMSPSQPDAAVTIGAGSRCGVPRCVHRLCSARPSVIALIIVPTLRPDCVGRSKSPMSYWPSSILVGQSYCRESGSELPMTSAYVL